MYTRVTSWWWTHWGSSACCCGFGSRSRTSPVCGLLTPTLLRCAEILKNLGDSGSWCVLLVCEYTTIAADAAAHTALLSCIHIHYLRPSQRATWLTASNSPVAADISHLHWNGQMKHSDEGFKQRFTVHTQCRGEQVLR